MDEDSRSLIEVFSTQMAAIDIDWDAFHQDYDAFRAARIELSDEEAAGRLGELMSLFGGIVGEVREMPSTPLTAEIASRSANAIYGEQLLLRRLLGAIGNGGTLSESLPVLPQDLAIPETVNGDGSTSGDTGADPSTLTLDGATVFDVFDTHISLVNGLRRSLRTDLDDARASLREPGQVNLSMMLWQTRALGKEWDDFHVEFDQLAPDQRRVRLKTGAGRPGLTGRRFRSDRKGH